MHTAAKSGRPRPPPKANRADTGHRHAPEPWSAPSSATRPEKRGYNARKTPVPPPDSKAESSR